MTTEYKSSPFSPNFYHIPCTLKSLGMLQNCHWCNFDKECVRPAFIFTINILMSYLNWFILFAFILKALSSLLSVTWSVGCCSQLLRPWGFQNVKWLTSYSHQRSDPSCKEKFVFYSVKYHLQMYQISVDSIEFVSFQADLVSEKWCYIVFVN